MPEREITENAVAALARALGMSLSGEDLANVAEGLRASWRDIASLDSLGLYGLEGVTGVEPAIVFRPNPPAQPR